MLSRLGHVVVAVQSAAVSWRWLHPSRCKSESAAVSWMVVMRLQGSQLAWVVGLVVWFGQVVRMPYVGATLLALPSFVDPVIRS